MYQKLERRNIMMHNAVLFVDMHITPSISNYKAFWLFYT
jgi:hypothetical protein